MSVKITALTPLNVAAIRETIEPGTDYVRTTATTAVFDMTAAAALGLVEARITSLGGGNSHPRGSLQAVARKLRKVVAAEQAAAADEAARQVEQHGEYTIESYRGRPADGEVSPPGSMGIEWPTGFSGHGSLVRNAAGEIVFAAAFRISCLEYVQTQTAHDGIERALDTMIGKPGETLSIELPAEISAEAFGELVAEAQPEPLPTRMAHTFSPSRELTDAIKDYAAETLEGTPAWALFPRWYVDGSALFLEASSGSTLLTVNFSRGDLRWSQRSQDRLGLEASYPIPAAWLELREASLFGKYCDRCQHDGRAEHAANCPRLAWELAHAEPESAKRREQRENVGGATREAQHAAESRLQPAPLFVPGLLRDLIVEALRARGYEAQLVGRDVCVRVGDDSPIYTISVSRGGSLAINPEHAADREREARQDERRERVSAAYGYTPAALEEQPELRLVHTTTGGLGLRRWYVADASGARVFPRPDRPRQFETEGACQNYIARHTSTAHLGRNVKRGRS